MNLKISEGERFPGFDPKAISFWDASDGFRLYAFETVFTSGPWH